MTRKKTKLEQLREVFKDCQRMLIVLQDNPDPDSIAAAVALRKLGNTCANIQCSIAHGGTVGRAENRALVKYLALNLRPFEELDFHRYDLIAVVDTQPWTGNNSLPQSIEPDIVIDHHRCRDETRNCRFTDIRSAYGATATILYEYLNEAKIPIEAPLATAMLYAIRSDTQDLGRDTTKADIDALIGLYTVANKKMLSSIQRGKVQRDYFQVLADGLRSARIYGNAIIASLGEITNSDMIAEIADLLLRDDESNWVMCHARVKEKLMISIRTEKEKARADQVIRYIVDGNGTGGGHPSYAGGQVPMTDQEKMTQDALIDRIEKRFLRKVLEKDTESKRVFLIKTD